MEINKLIRWRRSVRAQLRKEFGYSTTQLDAMTDAELCEAYNDLKFLNNA